MFRWIWLGISLAGCGSVVDGSYRGEPLAELSGNIVVAAGTPSPTGALRVALLWSGAEGTVEQDVVTVLDFPARYTLTLYTPPPDAALFTSDYTEGGPIAVGAPLLYEDVDGDGVWSRGTEPVIGAAVDAALVYVSGELELEGDASELHAGYHVLAQAGALCDVAGAPPLQTTSATAVDVLVGDYAPFLLDVDCDGDSDEWGEADHNDGED